MIADLYHLVRHFPAFLIDKKKKTFVFIFYLFSFSSSFSFKTVCLRKFHYYYNFFFQGHFAINRPKEYISISTAFLKHNCGRALIMQIK